MKDPKFRIALIPAYEPDLQMVALVKHTREQGMLAIVIDDGSGAAYTDIFQQVSGLASVLTHAENYGKGCALKTGMQYVQKHFQEPYTVVTMDADGQHQIADAVRVCDAAEKNPDSLILGSRRLQGNIPLRSQFGNTATRFVYRKTTGLHVRDTQTGLRAFSHKLLPKLLEISGERYEYEMNVLLAFAKEGIPIVEIEITTIYIDNNAGSHFDTVKDSYRIYRDILKYSASSFLSFLLDYVLYSLFAVFTAGLGSASLTVSNLTARVLSAGVNFGINRKFVFQSEKNLQKSALQYVTLAAVILLGNTLVLNFFVRQAGLNRFAAKLITEITFFALSWLVQRFVIFRKKEVSQ